VLLEGQVSGAPSRLVAWELPSTHAADPIAQSGIFSNQQFVLVISTFNYGQDYRLRTVVNETQGAQQSVLDDFGNLISASTTLPLAQGISSHASTIQIGNNSTLRATDTLLDFVFVRPATHVEPVVTVTRIR